MDQPTPPTLVVTPSPQPSKPFLLNKYKKLVVLFSAISLLGVSGFFLYQWGGTAQTINTLPASSQNKKSLDGSLKKLALASKQSQTITTNLNLGDDQTLDQNKYKYYLKAYQKLYTDYQTTPTQDGRTALFRLGKYLQSFPEYKQGDFTFVK